MKDFSKRLNEQNVSLKNYPYIIDYYLDKIESQQNNSQTEFYKYFTIVFIPVLIGYLNNFEKLRLYVFILAILGVICVPLVMIFIDILKKKEFLYNGIIHYLRRLNQIENSKTNNLSESSESNVEEKKITFNERNLHSLLASFVTYNEHFKCYAKSIHNERSGSIVKIQNKWVHPDIVGVYFPFTNPINKNGDYEKSTINLIKGMSESAIKLYSFKIKLEVNSENLRECYFQAVSNSSWANEGYLVALKYEGGDKMFDEMKRLTNAFGIGFIELNSKNVEQSRVLVAAQTKLSIDWNTVNRLVKENSDFKDFINFVNDRN
ncbi:HrgA protein [Treponema pectinovorum]|uniref:HrgA protein n=1 Tax=Treponema pectinovorum TaxID=164 RepID=UPI0011CCCA63|nr:HrgA protein [Treponema pectinovorum]